MAVSNRGSISAMPSMVASAGFKNSTPHTIDDTELPGKPSIGVSPSRPKIKGLPGRMAICQKSTCSPTSPKAACTRSCSPTEAPPVVTRMSAPLAPFARARIEATSSVATMSDGPKSSPGRTISSPVASSATRGWRRTRNQGTFMAAARPISRAFKTRPASSKTSPASKSKPAGRT